MEMEKPGTNYSKWMLTEKTVAKHVTREHRGVGVGGAHGGRNSPGLSHWPVPPTPADLCGTANPHLSSLANCSHTVGTGAGRV